MFVVIYFYIVLPKQFFEVDWNERRLVPHYKFEKHWSRMALSSVFPHQWNGTKAEQGTPLTPFSKVTTFKRVHSGIPQSLSILFLMQLPDLPQVWPWYDQCFLEARGKPRVFQKEAGLRLFPFFIKSSYFKVRTDGLIVLLKLEYEFLEIFFQLTQWI